MPDELLNTVYPCKTVSDNGINLALSTDGHVVKEINPWVNMETVITRKPWMVLLLAKAKKSLFNKHTIGSAIADNLGHIKEAFQKENMPIYCTK